MIDTPRSTQAVEFVQTHPDDFWVVKTREEVLRAIECIQALEHVQNPKTYFESLLEQITMAEKELSKTNFMKAQGILLKTIKMLSEDKRDE